MSESCSGSCESCHENCSSRKEDLHAAMNEHSNIKKVIAVVSGKGGVGKSTLTSLLATAVRQLGMSVGILDADITGPSIPKAFGVTECSGQDEKGLYPALSAAGTKIMSINLLLDDETSPVLWRGPILAGAVKQFWTDVVWGDVDYLFVDMPPGTGDVPLTVFQSLPIDGILLVTSPQDLVSMIVSKAVNMANMMQVPVLGFVENYSYLTCPDCGRRISVFGPSHLDEAAERYGIPVLARLPIDPNLARLVDAGEVEQADTAPVAPVVAAIL